MATYREQENKPLDLTSHTIEEAVVTHPSDGTADADKVQASHDSTVIVDPDDPLAVTFPTPDNPQGD